MGKKFSIILPTRGRANLLSSLINSVIRNTAQLSDVEMLFAVDNDDELTKEYLWGISALEFIKPYLCEQSRNFSRDYYNMLARNSSGKWIIACNDDAEFTTPGWDVIAEQTLEKYNNGGPNVVMGWVEDHLGEARCTAAGNYCCFPIIGREGFEIIGHFFPEWIPTWGADVWAWRLYDKIKRVVNVPITIKHVSHHNKLREQDEISKKIQENYVHREWSPTNEEVNALRRRLGIPH